MVFSSVPLYLDPPNWPPQQQHNNNNHQGGGSGSGGGGNEINPQLPPLPRGVGSMADRARQAKTPHAEAPLKCPRCESTNTKFCYYNNYSLSQPRYFCKSCRRYWTKGGTLRNVPVGGGCRKNKRSKGSSRSKSPATSSAVATSSVPSNPTDQIITHMGPPSSHLPFWPPLQHLPDYVSAPIALNFAPITDIELFQPTSTNDAPLEHWRLQQPPHFPFLEPAAAGLLPFDAEPVEPHAYSKPLESAVKMEDNNQGLNLSKTSLGIPGNDQYWGANAWTDFSAFTSSSSTPHLL